MADGAEMGGDAFFFNRYLEVLVKVGKDDDALGLIPSIDVMVDDYDDASMELPPDIGNIQTKTPVLIDAAQGDELKVEIQEFDVQGSM